MEQIRVHLIPCKLANIKECFTHTHTSVTKHPRYTRSEFGLDWSTGKDDTHTATN